MPVYDCGVPDCAECQRAFGPDRSIAIAEYQSRLAAPPHKPIDPDEYLVSAARQVIEKFDALGADEKSAMPPLALLTLRQALYRKDGLTILGYRSIKEEIAAIEADETPPARNMVPK